MYLPIPYYRLIARLLGGLLCVGGAALCGLLAWSVLTGVDVLSDTPLSHPLSPLLLASVGALALPLGIALLGADGSSSTTVRLAGRGLGLMALVRGIAWLDPEIRALVGMAPLTEFFVLGAAWMVLKLLRPRGEAAIELHLVASLEVPAHAVWHVLGERFGEVHHYARGVQHAVMDGPAGVGAVRTCQTQPFGPFASSRITEELVEYSNEGMRFTYVAGGELPSFITSARNRWRVEPNPHGSRVVAHASIDLVWWALPLAPLLELAISGEAHRFIEDFRAHLQATAPAAAGQAG